MIESLCRYLPQDRLQAIAFGESLPDRTRGSALFADISGFTPLTEGLTRSLGPRRGAEELTRRLDTVFDALIEQVERYGGSVLGFAGDAIICWFDARDGMAPARAVACALSLQQVMSRFVILTLPDNTTASLAIKTTVASGLVRRFTVGDPEFQLFDTLAGATVDRTAAAEHLAQRGEILVDSATLQNLGGQLHIGEWREDSETRERFVVVRGLAGTENLESNRPTLNSHSLSPTALRPWLIPAIYEREQSGQGAFLTEFRSAVSLFLRFVGLNYELDDVGLHLDAFIHRVQEILARYEGTMLQLTIGDKGSYLYAAFGAPITHEDDTRRALKSAFELRQAASELGFLAPVQIGISQGTMRTGSYGGSSRRTYGVLGDEVNLAARLMALANPGEVLVSERIQSIMGDQFSFEPRPPIHLKGKSELISVFRVVAEITSPGLDGTVSTHHPISPIIGRVPERTRLAERLTAFQRGESGAVIIEGDVGIGKSRLVADLLERARAIGVMSLIGAGDAIEKRTPYQPWRSIFNKVFQIEETLSHPQLSDEDRYTIRERVFTKLRDVDPSLVRYAPLLEVVLPINIPDTEFTSALTGEIRGSNIREVLVRLLNQEAAQEPLLIVMEDLHWLDSASWTLLADVHQYVRRLLLVMDTRPLVTPVPKEFQQIADSQGTEIIKLDAMPLDEVEALVCQRLGVKSIPSQVGKLIREKSEGHPFFAEELGYALMDTGILIIQNEEAHLSLSFNTMKEIALPDTLQAAITNRIDNLNPTQQLTLKVASVIGRIFAFRILQAIYPVESDRSTLGDSLGTLTRLNLTLIESETPDLAYIFKHVVTQEVAYNLMVFAQRRQLHQAVARWIEQSYQQDIESYYTLLAYHWTQAAHMSETAERELVIEKSVDYLEKAGNQSLNNFANAEAVEFFSEVLRLVDTNQLNKLHLGQLYRKIGDAYLGLGKLVEAKEYIHKAMATLGKPLPASDLGLLAGILGHAALQFGHRLWPDRFRNKELDQEEEGIRSEIVHLCHALAVLQFLNGDPNPLPMIFSVMVGLNVAETMKDESALWSNYATMSALMGFIPLHSQMRYYKEQWEIMGEKVDDPNLFIDGAISLSAVESGYGMWLEVKDLCEKASAICEDLGDHRRGGEVMAYLAVNTLLEAGPKAAEPYNQREWEIAMRRENPIHIAFAYQVDCSALVWKGELDACIAEAEKCIALFETSWVGDIPETIVRSAMWLAKWLKGERQGTWESVKAALDKFGKASMVDFSGYLIHSHLAEVAFLALEEVKANNLPKAQMAEREVVAKKAIKNLKKFTGNFVIGEPALNRYRGNWEWHHNRPEKAYSYWIAAADKAHALPMSYEAGRADLLLGQQLPSEHPDRSRYIQQAVEVFKASGYENWAKSVERAQQGM